MKCGNEIYNTFPPYFLSHELNFNMSYIGTTCVLLYTLDQELSRSTVWQQKLKRVETIKQKGSQQQELYKVKFESTSLTDSITFPGNLRTSISYNRVFTEVKDDTKGHWLYLISFVFAQMNTLDGLLEGKLNQKTLIYSLTVSLVSFTPL